MRRLLASAVLCAAVALAGCGDPTLATPRTLTARQALTTSPEALEFETPAARQELFDRIVRTSKVEAGRDTSEPVLFPMFQNGRFVAAPGLDEKADLLGSQDLGRKLQLRFNGDEPWPEERRDSLQGLSEREVAELVARSLLGLWGVQSEQPIVVERAPGAAYAAAYADGMLRINPSFLYLAASVGPASVPTQVQ